MKSFKQFIKEEFKTLIEIDRHYDKAGGVVDGLKVVDDIPNMSSIGASLFEYEILQELKEIPIKDFENTDPFDLFVSKTDFERVIQLSKEIKDNGWIKPLIVVFDDHDSPYVLEGGHRFAALMAQRLPPKIIEGQGVEKEELLDKDSLPALVVADLEYIKNE